VECRFFADVPANPEIATVRSCLELFNTSVPEAVLAVGGGSVIDTAKAVIAFSSGASDADILANRFDPGATRPRFWAAPTTAGSGSEATHFAVLYKDQVKYSIANQALKPDTVFLDPELVVSCPVSLTLASGADAVCQAVESWWNKGAFGQSRTYALEALDLLLTNLFKSVEDPASLAVRGDMLEGAHLAGRAINLTKTTAGHALSYGLTSTMGLPHGLAVLAVMGPLVEYMDLKHRYFSSSKELDEVFQQFGGSFVPAFLTFREKVLTFPELVHSNMPLPSNRDTAKMLAAGVNVERLSNHPVDLTDKDMSILYQHILSDLVDLHIIKDIEQ
jgi:alcohol dehydrogenase class IV